MIIIRHLSDIPPACRGGVVAIGNFDGLHRGHQHLIDMAIEHAQSVAESSIVLSFEPHPKHFFAPHLPPFRLTPFAAKSEQLRHMGVDYFLCLAFDSGLANLSAEKFIQQILINSLDAQAIFVGSDFVFGQNRGGDTQKLENFSNGKYSVHPSELLMDNDGEIISSSRVREALKLGNIKLASQLLGRPWQIIGHVHHGRQLGRSIGFPTANISLMDYQRPRYGVYAVNVRMGGWKNPKPAIANVGLRPTVDGSTEQMEIHVFDFSADIYGQKITVDFIDFIREEKKFDGIDALRAQIAQDCAVARNILTKK